MWTCLILQLVLIFFKDSFSLKSVTIHVPRAIKSGDPVTMSCDYDLEQVPLYTIKWYKDDVEFYRYVPKESPASRAYSVPYINVDFSKSGPKAVTLRGTRKELSGDYKCEVSAEAPLFHTEIKSAHLVVAELPTDDPTINLEQKKVQIGGKLRADCFAAGSDPPINLTWFINDEEITEDTPHVKLFPITLKSDVGLGLYSTLSELEIVAMANRFVGGYMALKCEGRIFDLWKGSAERFVRDENPPPAPPVLGSTSSQSHTDESLSYFESSSKRPSWLSFTLLVVFWLMLVR